MRTSIIKFNLKDNGRVHTGIPRRYDIPKMVKLINSNAVQERVKQGDLNGYYGHLARIQFGPEPQEGGIVAGQMIYLEPCCRTVYLKAYDDGTVEHQQEFFNTDLGVKAWKRLQDKSGGFSGVFSRGGSGFHGFDYVNEPNYGANRPYTLDDANSEDGIDSVLMLDDVGLNDTPNQLGYLLDCLEIYQETNAKLIKENSLLTDSIAHLQAEHDVLLDDLIIAQEEANRKAIQRYPQPHLAPNLDNSISLDDAISQANKFKQAKLARLEEEELEIKDGKQNRQLDRLMGRYGY